MYINEVHELVRAIAQASSSGRATVANVKTVEELGVDVISQIADFYATTTEDTWLMVERGEVCDSTFITCVAAAVGDVV